MQIIFVCYNQVYTKWQWFLSCLIIFLELLHTCNVWISWSKSTTSASDKEVHTPLATIKTSDSPHDVCSIVVSWSLHKTLVM